jgi:hypothetical protein
MIKPKHPMPSAADHWTVGDVVYTQWGHNQTNVDFFQITQIKAKSVIVRQIAENSSDRGGPSGGRKAPRRYEFIGPDIHCPLTKGGHFNAGPCGARVVLPMYRQRCFKWTGAAVNTSSYA